MPTLGPEQAAKTEFSTPAIYFDAYLHQLYLIEHGDEFRENMQREGINIPPELTPGLQDEDKLREILLNCLGNVVNELTVKPGITGKHRQPLEAMSAEQARGIALESQQFWVEAMGLVADLVIEMPHLAMLTNPLADPELVRKIWQQRWNSRLIIPLEALVTMGEK